MSYINLLIAHLGALTSEASNSMIRNLNAMEKVKEWVVYGICLLCIVLFGTSAYNKLAEHESFLKGLSKVSFIGTSAIYVAWLVPLTEVLITILLIIPQTQRTGLYTFIGLMTLFTGYIMSMLFWAEKLPCHCNLIIEKLSWEQHVWLNLGFITLAVCALWLRRAKNDNNISR